MKKVLIIEDDPDISELISIHLADMGFQFERSFDGVEGLMKAMNEPFDFIILDIMLPRMDGIEVCKAIRMERINTPILMLTAKSDELDKIIGLEIGADDYMTKPFSIRELSARIKAILRRIEMRNEKPEHGKPQEIRRENLFINIPKRIVEVYDNRVELSPKEFDIIVLLASNPGRTYTRSELLDIVWGYDFSGFEHTVNSHINRLRSKIEKDVNNPEFIQTTWGVGYRYNEDQ